VGAVIECDGMVGVTGDSDAAEKGTVVIEGDGAVWRTPPEAGFEPGAKPQKSRRSTRRPMAHLAASEGGM
jgi:hypothetical protein